MLRLAFVTGTEPGKWFARYREYDHGLREIPSDDPFALIESGEADLALMRLPDSRVGEPGDTHHRVVLYSEKPGVAVPKDSVFAEVGKSDGAIALRDFADEHVNFTYGEGSIDDLRMALQVVAANVGVAFAPAPLLKVLAKKQVVALELVDDTAIPHTPTEICLVWKVTDDNEAIQDFVGVARGRTRNSSRSEAQAGTHKAGSRSRAKPGSATRSRRPTGKSKPKVNGKRGGQHKGRR